MCIDVSICIHTYRCIHVHRYTHIDMYAFVIYLYIWICIYIYIYVNYLRNGIRGGGNHCRRSRYCRRRCLHACCCSSWRDEEGRGTVWHGRHLVLFFLQMRRPTWYNAIVKSLSSKQETYAIGARWGKDDGLWTCTYSSCTPARSHACMHARTLVRTHAHLHAHTHACARIHVCRHYNVCTHVYTYVYTYTLECVIHIEKPHNRNAQQIWSEYTRQYNHIHETCSESRTKAFNLFLARKVRLFRSCARVAGVCRHMRKDTFDWACRYTYVCTRKCIRIQIACVTRRYEKSTAHQV